MLSLPDPLSLLSVISLLIHPEIVTTTTMPHDTDLKPDNIGFSLEGGVKILDFGLARLVEHASVNSNEVYQMSGETGSLRYMAPGM